MVVAHSAAWLIPKSTRMPAVPAVGNRPTICVKYQARYQVQNTFYPAGAASPLGCGLCTVYLINGEALFDASWPNNRQKLQGPSDLFLLALPDPRPLATCLARRLRLAAAPSREGRPVKVFITRRGIKSRQVSLVGLAAAGIAPKHLRVPHNPLTATCQPLAADGTSTAT